MSRKSKNVRHLPHSAVQHVKGWNLPCDMTLYDRNKSVLTKSLPLLLSAANDIIAATGYRWKPTSLLRRSPSHSKALSIDLAPDIAKESEHLYAVTSMSDPVLYKREGLIRDLQKLSASKGSSRYPGANNTVLGIFIEPDHLHVQVFDQIRQSDLLFTIVKWGQAKPCYHDTLERSSLPLISIS